MSSGCSDGLAQDYVGKGVGGYFLASFNVCKGFYSCICNAFDIGKWVAGSIHDLWDGSQ